MPVYHCISYINDQSIAWVILYTPFIAITRADKIPQIRYYMIRYCTIMTGCSVTHHGCFFLIFFLNFSRFIGFLGLFRKFFDHVHEHLVVRVQYTGFAFETPPRVPKLPTTDQLANHGTTAFLKWLGHNSLRAT